MICSRQNKMPLLLFVIEVVLIICLFTNDVKAKFENASIRPHIIFIIADDLGWNDVGFHGSSQIPTPNIDALAYSGVILNRYYVTPICTPSRSALMTGKYPIHTGMQHGVLYGAEPSGLPLNEKLLPEYLKDLGYRNHIVGKWHLGSYKEEYTPLARGFESHLGYWTGHQDYFDHTAVENPGWGLDMRRNMDIAYDLHGKYSTDIFTQESVQIISKHNTSQPLFLYLAHAAVHSGNPYNPLPSPDSDVAKFSYIKDYRRQRFAGMLSKLDESVGEVVKALKQKEMLQNSLIVFTTDNGGPAAGFNLNAASNFPLRGVKNTLWEGGVRGAALIWSPLIEKPSRVSKQLMHISDWLPTLLSAADNGNKMSLNNIDGLSMWEAISKDSESARNEVLHNIDDIYGNAALTIGTWKILKGTTYNGSWDSWYGPSGRDYIYDTKMITTSPTGHALQSIGALVNPTEMASLRKQADVVCKYNEKTAIPCEPLKSSCLFNVLDDPCEARNVAKLFPKILSSLEESLSNYNLTAVPPLKKPIDPRGDPKYWNYVWTNFGDKDRIFNISVNML